MNSRDGFLFSVNTALIRCTLYPKISLREERRLIAKAKKGSKKEIEELVLRHLSFILYRIHKKAFPSYIDRFGEDIFSEAVFILYEK